MRFLHSCDMTRLCNNYFIVSCIARGARALKRECNELAEATGKRKSNSYRLPFHSIRITHFRPSLQTSGHLLNVVSSLSLWLPRFTRVCAMSPALDYYITATQNLHYKRRILERMPCEEDNTSRVNVKELLYGVWGFSGMTLNAYYSTRLHVVEHRPLVANALAILLHSDIKASRSSAL